MLIPLCNNRPELINPNYDCFVVIANKVKFAINVLDKGHWMRPEVGELTKVSKVMTV